MKLRTHSLVDGRVLNEKSLAADSTGHNIAVSQPIGGKWLPVAAMDPTVPNPQQQRWSLLCYPIGEKQGNPQHLPLPRNKDRLEFVRHPMTLYGSTLLVVCKHGILAYTRTVVP